MTTKLKLGEVLVNRLGKQDGISTEDIAKIFGAPVHATFPNDYLSIHKGLTTGAPLGVRCTTRRLGVDMSVAAGRRRGSGR